MNAIAPPNAHDLVSRAGWDAGEEEEQAEEEAQEEEDCGKYVKISSKVGSEPGSLLPVRTNRRTPSIQERSRARNAESRMLFPFPQELADEALRKPSASAQTGNVATIDEKHQTVSSKAEVDEEFQVDDDAMKALGLPVCFG